MCNWTQFRVLLQPRRFFHEESSFGLNWPNAHDCGFRPARDYHPAAPVTSAAVLYSGKSGSNTSGTLGICTTAVCTGIPTPAYVPYPTANVHTAKRRCNANVLPSAHCAALLPLPALVQLWIRLIEPTETPALQARFRRVLSFYTKM